MRAACSVFWARSRVTSSCSESRSSFRTSASLASPVTRDGPTGLLQLGGDALLLDTGRSGLREIRLGDVQGTAAVVASIGGLDAAVVLVSNPVRPIHRFTVPYHGVPGKGSAFRFTARFGVVAEAPAPELKSMAQAVGVSVAPLKKLRVLFVCIGNACRSQMAEGFARHLGADVVEVQKRPWKMLMPF